MKRSNTIILNRQDNMMCNCMQMNLYMACFRVCNYPKLLSSHIIDIM